MYDVNDYGRMMTYPLRMRAFTEALREAVTPTSVVLDVGTGTGVFAFTAARLGARRVYAVDRNPCIHLARQTAQANRLASVIEFTRGDVWDLTLPEKVDVIVGDCRGSFCLSGRNPELMFRARDCFLKPGGRIIAERDDLFVALVEWSDGYAALERPWQEATVDWGACRREAMSQRFLAPDPTLQGAKPLCAPAKWGEIAYATDTNPRIHGRVHLQVTAGTAHFVALFFKGYAGSHAFGSHPDLPPEAYRPLLLPLDPALEVGSEEVDLEVTAIPGKTDYVFAWHVRAARGSRRQTNGGNVDHLAELESLQQTGHLTTERRP